ncbi:MAG: type IV pilus assembly protein PilM [Armatimonadota bacterium]
MARAGAPMLGLDIGTHTISAVELGSGREGIELLSRPAIALTPPDSIQNDVIIDPETLGLAIREMLREAGIRTTRVTSAVGGQSSLVVRITEVPRMSPSELKEAMQWDVERHIPFPAESIIVDYQAIERPDADAESQNMEVLLAVAQEDMINAHVETLQAAGLQPEAIDVQPLAVSRALVNLPQEQMAGQTVVIINVGASTTDIVIVRDLILSFVRPIPIAGDALTRAVGQGFIVEDDEAERLKKLYANLGNGGAAQYEMAPPAGPDLGGAPEVSPDAATTPDLSGERTTHLEIGEEGLAAPAPAPAPAAAEGDADYTRRQVVETISPVLNELTAEIRRSLDFYRRQRRNENIDRLLLVGGTANIPNLPEFIGAETGITSTLGDPYAWVHSDPSVAAPDYLRDVGPVTAVAAGLAMRDMVE